MYLVSYGQFNDVVCQENGKLVASNIIVPSFDELGHDNQWQINGVRLYGRLIKIGTHDGHPILTFTATRYDFAIGTPSEAYIKMIVAGLEETYPCLRKSEILEYLGSAAGVHGTIDGGTLARWILGS